MQRISQRLRFLFAFCLLALSAHTAAAKVQLQQLRCEMLSEPLGIDALRPRLSWEIVADERDVQQTAYQIMVASSAEKLASGFGDLWNSGKIASGQSVLVSYKGKVLQSRTSCYWTVKIWTNKGETGWSTPAHWSMGLLNKSDWQAKWTGMERAFPWDSVTKFSRLSARYFRKEFKAPTAIKKAMVYVAAGGLYELYLNGRKVGDQVLAPAQSDFRESVLYNTYDVTTRLQAGRNAIGVVLGNGRFFTMRQDYKPKKITTFGYPKMLLQMEVEYVDGTRAIIASDDTWKMTADGPIRTNNEYDGEEYDARKELKGWNTAGFNDRSWLKPELVDAPGGKLTAQVNEPIRVVETIRPIKITKLKADTFILDMGQNMVGWLRMNVKGRKGNQVTLRFAETLKEDSGLYMANLRDAKVTDVYTLDGSGVETWNPTFVYHGFRYVEVTGYPGTPTLADFDGAVINDDLRTIGQFETSNPLLNQIYKNAFWGIRGNYKGMPLDCPQRNERMPWLGDRATGSLGESYVFDNAKLYAKWLNDIEESQTAAGSIPDVAPAYWNYYSDNMTWPGTYLLIADMLHNQFGDQSSIEKHYPSMKLWMEYMRGKYLKDGLMTKDKYGDWCVPPESLELIHSRDSNRNTSGVLIASAYYYRMLTLMERFAQLQSKAEDATTFSMQKETLKEVFNKAFFNTKTVQYDNGTVTANLLPLYFGMVPEQSQKALFENMVDKIVNENKGHISTGVIGTQWLMRGLTMNGRADVAYQLATIRDYPSWGYMVDQGATTIWELWNGNTANPAMNSRNHIMLLGDLITWFYEGLAGIKTDSRAPGFKQLEMKPMPVNGLDFVNAAYNTPYGWVKSDWKKTGNQFIWNVSIPANSKAIIYIPTKDAKSVKDGGKAIAGEDGIKSSRMQDGKAVVEIGSGDYSFTADL